MMPAIGSPMGWRFGIAFWRAPMLPILYYYAASRSAASHARRRFPGWQHDATHFSALAAPEFISCSTP